MRAIRRSTRCVRTWRGRGSEAIIAGSRVVIIDETRDRAGPTLALAGIFRPKLIVSREIIEALPADQLVAALLHERAHANAWDNFKRLLMLMAPDAGLFPKVDRAWARFAEWSADDRASEGDANRPVSLAAALLSVARMQPAPVPPLATALTANAADLQVRVERLLRKRDETRPAPAAWIAGCLLTAGALAMLALHPATLSAAHAMLERLVD